MSRQRIAYVVVLLAVLIVAALAVRTTVATSAVVTTAPDLSDYALRHPGMTIEVNQAPDLSDYALRHPNPILAIEVPDVSDYAQRHPEVLKSAELAVPNDWFQRHPDSIQGKSPASSIDALNSARWDAINAAYQQRYQGLFGQAAVDRAASLRSQGLNERYGLSR